MIGSLPVNRHEDDRRILIEWIVDFPIRTCKAIIVKKDFCVLGNHYHKDRDEVFYLLKGQGSCRLNDEEEIITEGSIVFAPRGVKHTFRLKKDSILLEAGNKAFDPDDENK